MKEVIELKKDIVTALHVKMIEPLQLARNNLQQTNKQTTLQSSTDTSACMHLFEQSITECGWGEGLVFIAGGVVVHSMLHVPPLVPAGYLWKADNATITRGYELCGLDRYLV